MVSDTVIGAVIGVSGAIIGSIMTGAFHLLSTRQQVEAENTRRYADYFLQEQVDSLSELHAQLERTYQNYMFNWEDFPRMEEQEYRSQILDSFYDFDYALNKASIFLDDEAVSKLNEVYEAFRWANGYFSYHTRYSDEHGPGDEIPEEYMKFNEVEMNESVESAREILRDQISKPAEYLENSEVKN